MVVGVLPHRNPIPNPLSLPGPLSCRPEFGDASLVRTRGPTCPSPAGRLDVVRALVRCRVGVLVLLTFPRATPEVCELTELYTEFRVRLTLRSFSGGLTTVDPVDVLFDSVVWGGLVFRAEETGHLRPGSEL